MNKSTSELDPFERARQLFDPTYEGDKPSTSIRPGSTVPGSMPAPANVAELVREPEPVKPDGVSRKSQAAEYLAKLRAHRRIIVEQYRLEDSYVSVEKFLKRDLHSSARSLGWSDAELYGVIPVSAGKQTAELVGAVARLSQSAGVLRVDAKQLFIEALTNEGTTRNEMPKPTTGSRGPRLIMLWDLPPRAASMTPKEYSDDQVTKLDSTIELRNAVLSLLKQDLGAPVTSQCATCKFFSGQGAVGFCRESPPSARNAELLAARLGVPVSTLPVSAAWPLTEQTSGCGYHQKAEQEIDTKSGSDR